MKRTGDTSIVPEVRQQSAHFGTLTGGERLLAHPESGIAFALFHPNLPLLVSVAQQESIDSCARSR